KEESVACNVSWWGRCDNKGADWGDSGNTRDPPSARAVHARIVWGGASLRGVRMADIAIADTMKFLDTTPPHGTTSLQRNIADGKPGELEYWSGAVVSSRTRGQ